MEQMAEKFPIRTRAGGPWDRVTERRAVEMLVRYAWNGLRATVMLRDLTRFGARIDGIGALRKGDWLTLLLPGCPATQATVAWTGGSSAGLMFDVPLASAGYDALIADYACAPSSAGQKAA